MQNIDLFENPNFKQQSNKNQKKITGYMIYSRKEKEKRKTNNLPDFYPPFPDKKYDIIYADPPWDYGGKLQFDKSSKSVDKIDTSKDIFISAANFKYPTVKTEKLKKMPVLDITQENSLLFMWVTSPHLKEGIELGESWGFKYKTIGFVWDKMVHNPGNYTLSFCELCLIFKKGKIPSPRGTRNEKQLIHALRGEHSVKPSEIREAIERMFPTQNKIELFARNDYEKWDCWGLDIKEIY